MTNKIELNEKFTLTMLILLAITCIIITNTALNQGSRIYKLEQEVFSLEQKMSLIEDSRLSFERDESGDLSLVWSVIEDGVEYPYARLPAIPEEGGEEDD